MNDITQDQLDSPEVNLIRMLSQLTTEEWRGIEDYKGYYEVSNLGRVRGVKRVITYKNGYKRIYLERYLPLRADRAGYVKVSLSKEGKTEKVYVHRLVCQAFKIRTRKDQIHVNHINGVKWDNRTANLHWCTSVENNKHAWNTGLNTQRGESHYNSKLTNEDVFKICEELDNGATQVSMSREFGVDVTQINGIYRGERWNWLTKRKGKIPLINKSGGNNPAARSIQNCRGEVFTTAKEAATYYSIKSPSTITKVCKGKNNTAGKYNDGTRIKWFYTNNKGE